MVLLELMLEQEEMYWFQRTRANWLKNSDRNASFFFSELCHEKEKEEHDQRPCR